jgi:hypothetical protein
VVEKVHAFRLDLTVARSFVERLLFFSEFDCRRVGLSGSVFVDYLFIFSFLIVLLSDWLCLALAEILSDFKLNVLEGDFGSWHSVSIVDGLVAFEASARVDPAVGVFLCISLVLGQHTDLRHHLVAKAEIV